MHLAKVKLPLVLTMQEKLTRQVAGFSVAAVSSFGSMPFCVELDNLKDTDAPIHQPAAMLVAAD